MTRNKAIDLVVGIDQQVKAEAAGLTVQDQRGMATEGGTRC